MDISDFMVPSSFNSATILEPGFQHMGLCHGLHSLGTDLSGMTENEDTYTERLELDKVCAVMEMYWKHPGNSEDLLYTAQRQASQSG